MARKKRLTSNEIEAANRAEITARLIRLGYRVYAPEVDSHGEDLVIRSPKNDLLSVQMKGRPTVNKNKYGGRRNIWMLFPDPTGQSFVREWYLIPHKILYKWMRMKHGKASGWDGNWSDPKISKELKKLLHPYRV